jgi:hypothetical protein
MPHHSKVAMLRGIEENEIIAGAYVDGDGGVCPMLAAHRTGGRTSLASFAKAWDRYTNASRARRASSRELRTLVALLEESLANDANVSSQDMRDAVTQHKALVAGRKERQDTGERDRTRELAGRHGWSWSRLFRRYDQYEAALKTFEELEESTSSQAEDRELTPVG